MNLRESGTVKELHQGLLRIQLVECRIALLKSELSELSGTLADTRVKAKVFDELCNIYEGFALPGGAYGRVSISIDTEVEAHLCGSIDDLLDQISNIDSKSRLWDAKMAIVIEQVEDLITQQSNRLQAALTAGRRTAAPARRIFTRAAKLAYPNEIAA